MPGFTYPSAIPSLTIGGRVFTDLANLKILFARSAGTGALNSSFREAGGTAGYVVPASKSFRIDAISAKMTGTAAAGASMGQLLYSDNDAGTEGATAFTNAKYPGNSSSLSTFGTAASVASPGLARYEEPFNFLVPTGKYIGLIGTSATVSTIVQIYGYEI